MENLTFNLSNGNTIRPEPAEYQPITFITRSELDNVQKGKIVENEQGRFKISHFEQLDYYRHLITLYRLREGEQ